MAQDSISAFKALGDENRWRIMEMLSQTGEICACKLLDELEISQPTLSHHMKVLCDCGLAVGRKEGRWMHYSVDRESIAALLEALQGLAGR